MAQEDRNAKKPENLRLSHRSRNRIRPENGQEGAERLVVSEIPGAGRRPQQTSAGRRPAESAAGQGVRRPQQASVRRPPGGVQSAAPGRQTMERPQQSAGQKPPGGTQSAAPVRQTTERPQQASVRRPSGGTQSAAPVRQTMERPQQSAGQKPPGGAQSAAPVRQTTERPQQASVRRPSGGTQSAAPGRQTMEKPQQSAGQGSAGNRRPAAGKSPRGSSEARWARWEEEKYRRQKAEKEERQKQKKLVILALAAAAAVLALALVLWLVFGKEQEPSEPVAATQESQTSEAAADLKLSDADFSFTVPPDKQEAGTMKEQKEVADYEGYAVHYPVLGNEAVDGAIVKRVDDIISVFKRQVQEMRTDGRTRMVMSVDYESYQTGEALVSVKFDVKKELPQPKEEGSMETYTYRLSDGAEAALSDVMTEGYLELLSAKTKEFAQAQGGNLKEGAAEAADANFRYYTWNEDGLTLYFPDGILIDGVSETLSFTIPMEELSGHLAMDLVGNGQETQAPVPAAEGVDPSKPMVCLTFDDGPKAATTSELLDILEENDARATFFVVGNALKGKSAEEIIRRELALGCQVGNHTATHENFKEISDEEIDAQIEGVNDILKGWGLPATSTVRPPYGGWNNHVRDVVKYPMARWNVDTLDWETKDPEATIQCVLYDEVKKAADGDIILMHDIHPETIEACRTIIPELKARGFQLVTMEEMFAAKGIPYEAGKVYYSSGDIRTDFGE